MAIWLFLSVRQGGTKAIRYIFIIAICLAGVYIIAFDAINTYLLRLTMDADSELNDVFTGRLGIWDGYIELVFSNPKILLFGSGFSTIADLGKGTHNTYLEALYNLGIVGTGCFLFALKQSFGKIVVRPIMWIPVIVFFVRLIAIGYLTHDNLWLHLVLFVIVAKELSDGENKRGIASA